MKKTLSTKEFSYIFDAGTSLYFFPIRLIAAQSNELLDNKAAFVVPKKLVKKAVCRNKIKRQMRAAFTNCQKKLPSLFQNIDSYGLIFIYNNRKITSPISFIEIENAIIENVKTLLYKI
ncbi:MAG: ribonuclease P protein component [Bacteroidales bacterium]